MGILQRASILLPSELRRCISSRLDGRSSTECPDNLFLVSCRRGCGLSPWPLPVPGDMVSRFRGSGTGFADGAGAFAAKDARAGIWMGHSSPRGPGLMEPGSPSALACHPEGLTSPAREDGWRPDVDGISIDLDWDKNGASRAGCGGRLRPWCKRVRRGSTSVE